MKLEYYRQIFEKYSNTKFHKNPSNGIKVVPCEWTNIRADRQTDIMKLIFDFRNFANALKKVDLKVKHAA